MICVLAMKFYKEDKYVTRLNNIFSRISQESAFLYFCKIFKHNVFYQFNQIKFEIKI